MRVECLEKIPAAEPYKAETDQHRPQSLMKAQ
jgi:hypothetical protein